VIFERTGGSGAWVAALVLTQFATSVFAAPWAGAIGDRFDRRVVMIGSDLLSAAVFVAVAFSHSAIQLVALAALAAIVGAPFGPASGAFLVMLVPEAQRPPGHRQSQWEPFSEARWVASSSRRSVVRRHFF
jgi:MFS family permease